MSQAPAARIVNARVPWALFLPLAALTEAGGVVLLWTGHGIGWAAVAAPAIGLLVMRGPVRPRFEFREPDLRLDEHGARRRGGSMRIGSLPPHEIVAMGMKSRRTLKLRLL